MKLNDETKLTITLWALVIAVLILAVILVGTMVSSINQAAPATHYGQNCLTELNEKPLTECKE